MDMHMQTYKLLEGDTVLLTQPHLIEKLGYSTALFLSQLNYWIQKREGVFKNNQRWIYNTAREWGMQIKISSRQVERIIKKLKDLSILAVGHFNKHNRVNYITINYKELSKYVEKDISPDIMSESDRHSVGIHIKNTKRTNKERNNKSNRAGDKKINEETFSSSFFNQVEQVNDLNLNQDKVAKNVQEHCEIKTTTAQDMLNLWLKAFPGSHSFMNKTIAKSLVASFNNKFSRNIMFWQNYIDRLQSSDFIMSKSFVLTLDWALKFKTIDRILDGDLGVKDILVKIDETLQETNAQDHIHAVLESDSCKNIRLLLIKAIGSVSYNAWFTKVHFVEKNGEIQMKAENKFIEDHITQHYGHYLKL
jgi:hypothetical protein